jgi:hypothetical protein
MYKVAALSDQGWVDDDKSILNHLFTCYMLTDAAQSLIFEGNLISLPQTYYRFINEPERMANQVGEDLQSLLGKYFVDVQANALAKEITTKHYAIVLKAAVVTSRNERLELVKVMEIDSHNLRKIIDVNNFGDGEQYLNSF